MPTTEEKLETLFAKVRALPKERQEAAVEALADIAAEPYQLSDDELSVLIPALESAQRGEFASDEEVSELLDKPWRYSSTTRSAASGAVPVMDADTYIGRTVEADRIMAIGKIKTTELIVAPLRHEV